MCQKITDLHLLHAIMGYTNIVEVLMEELTVAGALVATEVIKSLAKDMASFVKKKVLEYYTDTTNQELIDSEWAFVEYLTKTREKYNKSKSILYRTEERELSSFFEPVDLRIKSERYFYGVGMRTSHKGSGWATAERRRISSRSTSCPTLRPPRP